MNYNNTFFSYEGLINRKNYIINVLILIALFIVISLVKFENFAQFTNLKFLFDILGYVVLLFKFIIFMSLLSLIYRRIADISKSRSYKFAMNMKKLFISIFVFPVLYFLCIRYFIDFMPVLIYVLDMLTYFVFTPLGIIALIVFSFIK